MSLFCVYVSMCVCICVCMCVCAPVLVVFVSNSEILSFPCFFCVHLFESLPGLDASRVSLLFHRSFFLSLTLKKNKFVVLFKSCLLL